MKNAFVIAMTATIFGMGVALAAPDSAQDQSSTKKADTATVSEGTTSDPQARTQATSRNPEPRRRSVAMQKWTPAQVVSAPAPEAAPAKPASAAAGVKSAAAPVADPKPVTATPSESKLKGKITRPGDGGMFK